MVKKIDALLQKRDTTTPDNASAPKEIAQSMPQQTPIEIRSPLEKRPGHIGPEPPHIQELSFSNDRLLPEEFRIDSSLEIEPEFKFITNLDSEESIMDIRPQHHDRIEVIDLRELTTEDLPSHLDTIIIANSHIQQNLQIKKQPKNKVLSTTAQEEVNKKEQVYYTTDTKNKKNNTKQNTNSDDLEKRLQALQKQLQQEQQQENSQKQHEKEEQQKKEKEEKQKKHLEQEEQRRKKLEEKLRKKLEKAEQKKHKIEEKIKLELEKEQEKLLKQELKKVKSKEKKVDEEKKEPQQEVQLPSVAFTKKQLKEQRRLDRLAARQAIFEERLKIKKEKRLLKERKKHLELMKDEIEKYTPEPIELDTDIKKILQITDELLGELPEEVINRFMRSDEFDLYERILNKYKIR